MQTKREAIEAAIAKWQRIVDGNGIDNGADDCALCALYLHKSCIGCPVTDAIGNINYLCRDTPYIEWCRASRALAYNIEGVGYEHTEESLAAAQKELDFLKSLKKD